MAEVRYRGLPTSGGVVLGKAITYWPGEIQVPLYPLKGEEIPHELALLEKALYRAAQGINKRREEVAAELGQARAAIFDAHLCLLNDPAFLGEIKEMVVREQVNGAYAVHRVSLKYQRVFKEMDDPYLRERAADINDVSETLLRELAGQKETSLFAQGEKGILIARDLVPSDIARLDRDKIMGLAIAEGAPTAHASILAKGWELPALVGCGGNLKEIQDGTPVLLDGEDGIIITHPLPETLQVYQNILDRQALSRLITYPQANLPAMTLDGQEVILQANVDSPKDLQTVKKYGARGIGLYRSEFLFLNRDSWPGEDDQEQVYREIIDGAGGQEVTIRTVDIGGDKDLPYLRETRGTNPFLGRRGIRWSLHYPDFFKSQLRAILKSGDGVKLKIMLPMVSRVDEILATKGLLEEVINELQHEQVPHCQDISLGIMVEIPAAVMIAPALMGEVDFVSIGTNDLTQYALAVDRLNQEVAHLYQSFHPAVIKLMEQTAQAAREHNKEIGVCGEMAGEPLALPLFLGMGIYKLSMVSPAIAKVKKALHGWTLREAREATKKALQLAGPVEVRNYLASWGRV